MTNFAIICLSVAVGFVALAGIFTISLLTAAKKTEPEPEPLFTAKGTRLGSCLSCGRPVAIRHDGHPYRSHRCRKAEPVVTVSAHDGPTTSSATAFDDPNVTYTGPERVA